MKQTATKTAAAALYALLLECNSIGAHIDRETPYRELPHEIKIALRDIVAREELTANRSRAKSASKATAKTSVGNRKAS